VDKLTALHRGCQTGLFTVTWPEHGLIAQQDSVIDATTHVYRQGARTGAMATVQMQRSLLPVLLRRGLQQSRKEVDGRDSVLPPWGGFDVYIEYMAQFLPVSCAHTLSVLFPDPPAFFLPYRGRR
jgi:hypothetical protein